MLLKKKQEGRRSSDSLSCSSNPYRCLTRCGFTFASLYVVPPLTEGHKKRRVEWCTVRQARILREPGYVRRLVFTDEKWFTTELTNAKTTILKPGEERPSKCKCQSPTKRMAWWGISLSGVTGVYWFPGKVDSEAYIACLKAVYLPLVRQAAAKGIKLILLQDGAKVHASKAVYKQLYEWGCEVSDWASLSADLNGIANMWFVLDYMKTLEAPEDVETMMKVVNKAAHSKQVKQYIQNTLEVWHGRLSRCIAASGNKIQSKGLHKELGIRKTSVNIHGLKL